MQSKFYILLLPLMLGGCFYNQTNIQGDYEEVRIDCQSDAEDKIGSYSANAQRSEKDRNAELVTLFSDCMAKSGWQVATPKREITSSTRMRSDGTMGRTQSETTATAQEEAPIPTNPQQAPVQDGAVVTESTALTPSPSMPPLRQPVNPNAATYQPAP